ncbi:MAG: hypothetical protein M1814_002466 [Vezdaea aestivalis]|nr:MAG: hypothetical protein M1814_002466 [Vezdaea aestivalis]
MKPIENMAPFELTAVDKKVLSTREEDFKPHTWEDASQLIAKNHLEHFKRRPGDLMAYISWSRNTTYHHGSLTKYVLKKRLRWPQDKDGNPAFTPADPTPFAHEDDYAILRNDWPYAFTSKDITHLIVWLKTPIEIKEDGDITDESRKLIAEFVNRTFTQRLKAEGEDEGEGKVLWFKNWAKLQSVTGAEHIHVLVKDAPASLLEEWTHRHARSKSAGSSIAGTPTLTPTP